MGPCFSFLYRFSTSLDHEDRGRIVLFGRLFVCKLGKYWQGVCLWVGWTEVSPGELSTVVPVEEHTRLVSPGQDTCDLDGGVEFFGFVLAVDSVRASFYFLPCVGTCCLWKGVPCGLSSILVGVCVMV